MMEKCIMIDAVGFLSILSFVKNFFNVTTFNLMLCYLVRHLV